MSRPKIVTICGSTRFVGVMAVVAWEEEKRGRIALSCHLLPTWYTHTKDHLAEEQGVADVLDALHHRKVEMADEILVVDVDSAGTEPYVGRSTEGEIALAHTLRKPVRYLSKEPALLKVAARPPLSDKVVEAFLTAFDMEDSLKEKSNAELAALVEEHVWADEPMLSPKSELLGEVIERLKAEVPPSRGQP